VNSVQGKRHSLLAVSVLILLLSFLPIPLPPGILHGRSTPSAVRSGEGRHRAQLCCSVPVLTNVSSSSSFPFHCPFPPSGILHGRSTPSAVRSGEGRHRAQLCCSQPHGVTVNRGCRA
ncbi:unnamed protein product, partial [Closterium sp. NIES-53]